MYAARLVDAFIECYFIKKYLIMKTPVASPNTKVTKD